MAIQHLVVRLCFNNEPDSHLRNYDLSAARKSGQQANQRTPWLCDALQFIHYDTPGSLDRTMNASV
jgi:hypothetical protein